MQRVLGFLATQESALVAGERRLRAGDQSAVHSSRVAVRRARSTLRTFGPLFHGEAVDRLDEVLRAHADRLGAVRDLEVLAELLTERVAGEPEVREWAVRQLAEELTVAWAQLELELAEHPPGLLQDHFAAVLLGALPHEVDLDRLRSRVARRARRRLVRAGCDVDELHRARKACKRARYAHEALGASAAASRWEFFQAALGDHHDAHVAAAWLDRAPWPEELRERAAAVAAEMRATADAELVALAR